MNEALKVILNYTQLKPSTESIPGLLLKMHNHGYPSLSLATPKSRSISRYGSVVSRFWHWVNSLNAQQKVLKLLFWLLTLTVSKITFRMFESLFWFIDFECIVYLNYINKKTMALSVVQRLHLECLSCYFDLLTLTENYGPSCGLKITFRFRIHLSLVLGVQCDFHLRVQSKIRKRWFLVFPLCISSWLLWLQLSGTNKTNYFYV